MGDDEVLLPPSDDWRDVQYQFGKALANIPTLGAAGPILDAIFFGPGARRRNEWMWHMYEAVVELQRRRGIDVQTLAHDEQFVSTLMQASQAAIRTHSQEKREKLRNAVLNAALPSAPNETLQQLFLAWVDELTPLHLRVLEFWHRPQNFAGTLENVLEKAFPEAKPTGGISTVIMNDLVSRNLVRPHKSGTVDYRSRDESRITPLGSAFLSFIRDPFEATDALSAP